MKTTPLKNYAPQARKDFIASVTTQSARLGITAKEIAPATVEGDVLLVQGQAFPRTVQGGRDKLIAQVKADGFNQVMDRIAYTWFNRFVAVRYMEVHNYLGHGYRVLSDPQGSGRPEILDHAADVDLPGLDRAKVVELKLDGTKDDELYRLLLKAQCNALNKAMPFLFEPIGHETELLLPANLLQTDSLIRKLVESIEEDAWKQIESIGWLYQFYISEKKDQVIGKVVKSEDIPAATQLFTPNWIVKYMVQNSLGAQWLATYPHSPLRDMMEYYIEPAEQTEEAKEQLAAITPDSLNPEEITLIDPACGSGHILVEAYDLFMDIYVLRGYGKREAAQWILTKNLYGLDIDQRAAQLSGFALMMKGRADDRRLFERDIKLNVMAMVNSDQLDIGYLAHPIKNNKMGLEESDLRDLKKLFEHATTFGSLIQIPEHLAKKLPALRELCDPEEGYLYVEHALESLEPLIRQAEMLAGQYDCVVANPPYMGSKGMDGSLKEFTRGAYPDGKRDLFACFVERSYTLATGRGLISQVTMQNWMFLSTFKSIREALINTRTIKSLVQIGYNSFPSLNSKVAQAAVFALQNKFVQNYIASFVNLNEAPQSADKEQVFLRRGPKECFHAASDDFTRIPGSPIAYWISQEIRETFDRFPKISKVSTSVVGQNTGDNDRFLRRWYEVGISRINFDCRSREATFRDDVRWYPYNKGGAYRKWYGNHDYVINWQNDAEELKRYAVHRNKGKHWSRYIQNLDYLFAEGITWSDVTSGRLAGRYLPPGFISDVAGHCAYFQELSPLVGLSILNSKYTFEISRVLNPTIHFQAGNYRDIPFSDALLRPAVLEIVDRLRHAAANDWDAYERSWNFSSHPILAHSANCSLESAYSSLRVNSEAIVEDVKRLEERNNQLFIDAYALHGELTPDIPLEQVTLTVNPAFRYGVKSSRTKRLSRFHEDTMQELISYAVGCMMGRYSLDEPGLIYAQGRNEGFEPTRYSKFAADEDGILPITDTAWFEDDAANRIVNFISVVWSVDHLEENLSFLASGLSPSQNETPRETIRRYLCDKFFKEHISTARYDKRPIYWLFSSGDEKAFQCLVYLHRYNKSTLARMRSEYVIPLQGKLAARLDHLKADQATASSSAQTKRLTKEADKLKKQQAELLKFDEKLRHYADRRISLDLDDGVKVNYGRFGTLLAEVEKIHGQKPEGP